MDATKFTIIITALDEASATVRKIATNIGGIGSRIAAFTAPLRSDFSAFAGATGLGALESRIGGIKSKFSDLAGSLGPLSGVIGGLGGGLAAGGLIAMAKKASDYGAALYDASIQTGIAAGQLQRLHYVAEQTGTSTEMMDRGLAHLNLVIGQAAGGHNKQALAMFHALGIHLKDNTGHLRTAASVYGDLSEAVQKNTNATMREQIVALGFGARMGQNLLPALVLGRQRTKELGDEVDRLRGPMTDAGAKAAKSAQESWTALSTAASGLAVAIGSKLVPVLMPLIAQMTRWISTHHDLATALAIGGAALGAFALVAGPVVSVIGLVGSTILTTGRTILFAISSVRTFMSALRLGFTAMEALSLANPFGLVIAGVVAVATASFLIWKYWEPIKTFFTGVWARASAAFKWGYTNILPFIPGGALVKLIVDNWSGITSFFQKVWAGIVGVFQKSWNVISPIVHALATVGNFVVKHLIGIDTDAIARAAAAHRTPAAFAQASGAHQVPAPSSATTHAVTTSIVSRSIVSQPLLRSVPAPALPKPQTGKLDVKVDFMNIPPSTKTSVTAQGNAISTLDTGRSFASP